MKKFFSTLVALMFVFTAAADEGMWLPSLIGNRIKDMRSKGFRLTAEDVYSINRASMKDAGCCSMAVALASWYRMRVCC
jgi:hypothetical protein